MGNDHLLTGQKGEARATLFLKNSGFTILATNFRTPFAEIDIIAKEAEVFCFIEVKTRTSITKALPKESVNMKKQKKIIMGARQYLKTNRLFHARSRFDVIEIILTDPPVINHLKNAFQAG